MCFYKTVRALKKGKIIAYPTEAVYGLGCDPFNEQASKQLLKLKKRDQAKGMILIAYCFEQIEPLIQNLKPSLEIKLKRAWPRNTTLILPASKHAPAWITGGRDTIAIRIPNHPVAKLLCKLYDGPIVSTSANLSDEAPLKTAKAVRETFGKRIDITLPERVGSLSKPTTIYNTITGKRMR